MPLVIVCSNDKIFQKLVVEQLRQAGWKARIADSFYTDDSQALMVADIDLLNQKPNHQSTIAIAANGNQAHHPSFKNMIVLKKPVRWSELWQSLQLLEADNVGLKKRQSIAFDPTGRRVRIDQKSISLTEKEVAIMACLWGAGDKFVPVDLLLTLVWPGVRHHDRHRLRAHLYRLRRKISPYQIILERQGYRLLRSACQSASPR